MSHHLGSFLLFFAADHANVLYIVVHVQELIYIKARTKSVCVLGSRRERDVPDGRGNFAISPRESSGKK